MKYLPSDKGTHYFYNQWVAIVSYLLLLTFKNPHALEIAAVFSIGVGVAVELYQKKTGKGMPEWRDLAWGTAGVLSAFAALLASRFLV